MQQANTGNIKILKLVLTFSRQLDSSAVGLVGSQGIFNIMSNQANGSGRVVCTRNLSRTTYLIHYQDIQYKINLVGSINVEGTTVPWHLSVLPSCILRMWHRLRHELHLIPRPYIITSQWRAVLRSLTGWKPERKQNQILKDTLYNYYINPYQAEQICTLSQWFSNLLPNWHPRLGLAEDSRTTDSGCQLVGVVGVSHE